MKQVALNQQDDLFIDDEPPQPEAPAEPQQEEETPEPPVPEPEAPAEPPQEEETPAPQITTTPAQEYAKWNWEGLKIVSLREFEEHTRWKQKIDLYDTSLLDL